MRNKITSYQLLVELLKAVPDGDACMPYGGHTSKGYCRVNIAGKQPLAHRLAYEIAIGPIPDGMFVCHKCDNRRCCRPSHLFLGTAMDNNLDCVAKGRHKPTRGTDGGNAKLTEAQVREIRILRENGYSQQRLGAMFGVHFSNIGRIVRGEAYNQSS